jgi:hypothetical protein
LVRELKWQHQPVQEVRVRSRRERRTLPEEQLQ